MNIEQLIQPVDRAAAIVTSQTSCKEDNYNHLAYKILRQKEAIEDIQCQLGCKRMFDANGKMLGIVRFEKKRRKLKEILATRKKDLIKLLDQHERINREEFNDRQGQKRRAKLIGRAFCTLCDDAFIAFGFNSAKDMAEHYIEKANK